MYDLLLHSCTKDLGNVIRRLDNDSTIIVQLSIKTRINTIYLSIYQSASINNRPKLTSKRASLLENA